MGEDQGAALWGSDPLAMLGEIELERLRSSLERRLFRQTSRRSIATLGRFEILEKLGRGGMGMVYAARDPDLCRVVALKVLRRDRQDSRATRRMMREARALARLKHPNVVEVYDVGHTASGELFIAMEYIRGPTLRQWLAEHKRRRSEILEKFCAVGRGLAAAHAAGVVHRDFKPENVIIGADGRPRVLDFGLAEGLQHVQRWPTLDTAVPDYRESEPERITEESMFGGSDDALVGTPAYMSPEQLEGGRIDPRSDQYAFCVALHEALLGRRPFEASSIAELRALVQTAERPAIPCCQLPRRLAKALLRGLSQQPKDRFVSLSALLDALEAAQRPAVTPLVFGSAMFCLAAALGIGSVWRTPPHPACLADAATEPAAASGWFAHWNEERNALCRRSSSENTRALDCLNALRRDLHASLIAAEEGSLQTSPLEAFPDPTVCRPSIPESSRLLHVRTARLRTMIWTEEYDAALAFGHELLTECRRLSDRAMESEAALLLAHLQLARGERRRAEALFEASYFAAIEAEHHENAVRAAAGLSTLLTREEGPPPAAMKWLHHAETRAGMAGSDASKLRGELLLARLAVLTRTGRFDDAHEAMREFERLAPPVSRWLRSQYERERGHLLFLRHQPEAAEHAFLMAVDFLAQHLGVHHLHVATLAEELAGELREAQRWDAAVALLERSLRVHERGSTPDHARVLALRLGLAELELLRHQPDAAAQALAAIEQEAASHDPTLLSSLDELQGRIAAQKGNHAAAVDHLRAALERRRSLQESNEISSADAHARLAISLARMDMIGEAFTHARLALDLARSHPDRPALLARASAALGDVTLQSGRPQAAIAPLRMAVRLAQSEPGSALSATERAQTRFLLAQALILSHQSPDEAKALLQVAGEGFRSAGWPDHAAQVTTWAARTSATPRSSTPPR